MNTGRQSLTTVEDKIESDIAETKELVVEEEIQLARIRELDAKIAAVQNSTQTLIPALAPLHNYCRSKWKWYYSWHQNKSSSMIHAVLLCLDIIILIIGIRGA